MAEEMTQRAPYPEELRHLVNELAYRPHWRFELNDDRDRGQGSEGLTFEVYTRGYDTYHPEHGERYGVVHYFPVPPAAYNRASWQRWIFERLLEVERHECAEFFQVDGERPYAPHHGPGWDPYIIIDHGSDEDVATRYTGELKATPREARALGYLGQELSAREELPQPPELLALWETAINETKDET